MRPALKPGLLPVWRNRDTLQIGIDPRRAVALTGMREAAGLLSLLDGSREHSQVLAAASELGIGHAAADRVMSLLAAGGVLHDFPASTYQALPTAVLRRLAPELATAALAHGDGDGGARTLARRQAACVRVHGTSPVGLGTAALLSAAGIGLVIATGLAGAGPAEKGSPNHGRTPGSSPPRTDAGPPLRPCVPAAQPPPQRRRSRARATGRSRRHPDLVVLADTHDRDIPATLVRDRVAHLVATASEAIGVVGPLVLPGRSVCVRCLDLTRADHDPAWPVILAQLAHGRADPPACDAVLATAVAAQVTAQALAFIDRRAPAAVTNGTLELVLPGWQWRRRTWQAHPRCDCGIPDFSCRDRQ
ncbi:MAG TPA: thiamine biosynthesis protein ThiF [Streptosporangiaceae bacterium]|nr:thiamine biosynthesis protein ThiF [Streptosporangiaceae bacterium]